MTAKPSAQIPSAVASRETFNASFTPLDGQWKATKPNGGRSRRRRRGRTKQDGQANEKVNGTDQPEGQASKDVADGWGTPGAWGNDWAGECNTNEQHWGHPIGAVAMTMEDEMSRQASLHFELAQQLVPFWLKGIEAAERGEPEPKLEAYWDEHITKVKASGWFWTQSDYDRDEQRRKKEAEEKRARGEETWSNHQENEDLWDANGWGGDAPQWDSSVRWQNWGHQDNQANGEGNGWEQATTKRQAKEPEKWWNRQPRHEQRNRKR